MKKTFLLLLCCILTGAVRGQTGHFFSSDLFSSSLISSLCQDRQGSIWIGTDYGLNRFDGYQFTTYLHDDKLPTSLSVNVVVSLLCDKAGNMWVGTNRGLDRYDAANDRFVHYPFPNNLHPRISRIVEQPDGTLFLGTAGYGAYVLDKSGHIRALNLGDIGDYFGCCFLDAQGRMWKSGFDDNIYMWKGKKTECFRSVVGPIQEYIDYQNAVLILGLHGLMIYRDGKLSLLDVDESALAGGEAVFSSMIASADGTIYIGTRGNGIFRLTTAPKFRLEPVELNAFGIDVQTAIIQAMMFDTRGNLWAGCHRKGLLMVPFRPMPFTSWSFRAQGLQLGSTISSVCEGDDGVVWCTVQGVGVYGFNHQGKVVAHPQSPESATFIFRDRQQRYWIGTDDALFTYDPLTGRYRQELTFDCDRFNDMTSDDKGRIYISTFSRGFCVYDPHTRQLLNHQINDKDTIRGRLCNNWVMGMTVDNDGLLWLATSSGIACYDPDADSFISQGWQTQLDGIVCFDVCVLKNGRLADGRELKGCIAIGTEEGLFLYDRNRHKSERFPKSDQLSNKSVSYIVQSTNGDLWCATSQGIWQYSQETKAFIGYVNGNGLTQKEYLYGIGMHTEDDKVFFGHNDGLTVFTPSDVNAHSKQLDPLQLSAFIVGNQAVNASTILNDVRVTERAVSESDHFTLSYLDHTVTLAFSQFNFDNPSNVTFEYRIGDGQWIRNTEGLNSFTLSHLQPGTYRVEVRAQVGQDYTPVKVIHITIKSPWYSSTLAYIIYGLILLSLIIFVYYTHRRRVAHQMKEEKMKFLINATHDIRSPLTLIMGPLAKLKQHLMPDQTEAQHDIDTIEHNAHRIQNLVNQILDVRKIDKQQMHLHCRLTNLVSFTQGICKMFEYNAAERHVNFSVDNGDLKELEVWIDRSQFDKVITNLLSNAFKYTFDEGTIVVRLSEKGQQACIEVSDTGIGLDPNSEKHIFDRFYQGSNSRKMNINGTGIGLNLCKMIVDMHHGTIEAHNRKDGQQGSVFTVTIPLGDAHLTEEEKEYDEEPVEVVTKPAEHASSQRHRVLVVDDDEELSHYITSELSRYYRMSTCANGKEALRELLTHDYDAVVSDVMMPEMDGFTMLRMIKTNLNISHIPVVMLTSKADVANRLEGLDRGADAFLAKPFDMDELHGVIENLIQGRQRLKGKFSGAQQQADKVQQPEVKGNDEKLMERIMQSVNKNLSDSDFSVEMLTRDVGMSRAQLHRKMKEMTGLSTSEFIRNIRLEQAARLLREQKINVTQIAYTVGFSNLAHFSTIFRKHFGVAPSEFAGKKNEE